MTFNQYGLMAYQVQYWTGSTWATIPSGSVSGRQVDRLLAGDGYQRVNEPQIGDVVVYRENGQVVHSTTVTSVENDQVAVSGLGGLQPVSTTTTPQGAWPNASLTYYRKPNDIRGPAEKQSHAERVRTHDKAQARLGAEIERQLGPPPPPRPAPKPKRGKKGSGEDQS